MSKAFTKENDDEEEPDKADTFPIGVKNYVTPQGYANLKHELRTLLKDERPKLVDVIHWAAKNGDRSENGDYIYGKKRLREIDRRMRYLTKRIENAVVVDPKLQQNLTKVFFGATVTFRQEGIQKTIKIVGYDEADLNLNKISWISPMAKTLISTQVGDVVKLITPSGVDTLEVLAIKYEVEES